MDRSAVDDSAYVGDGADVDETCVVESRAVVVGRVRILSGSLIGPGAVIEGPRRGSPITVGPSAVIGAGAVVSACDVGEGAVLRPGTVTSWPVPRYSVVSGNPARIESTRPSPTPYGVGTDDGKQVLERQEQLVRLTYVTDLRGSLTAGQFPDTVPFRIARFFFVTEVPGPEVRGEHAHIACHQLLLAVSGSLEVICDDGQSAARYLLDKPDVGLHIPPMTWAIQHRYAPGTVLLVLASRPYEEEDYIRDYPEFLRMVSTNGT